MKRLFLLALLSLPFLAWGREGTELTDNRALEVRFDSMLRSENIEEWIREFSDRPHHVGSSRSREIVAKLVELFESWGYETRIDEYQILFPTPRVRIVEMLHPFPFRARLEEGVLSEAGLVNSSPEALPVYNAYSVDGDVSGELVYVNYGTPGDYEQLERFGIDVRGKLVIARYGGSWRGIKPKVAAERGAIGCLIYSDPFDDGYYRGDAYPEGPYRSEWGAQRGSVADMPLFPGDPLTPGTASVEAAVRLPVQDAPTLARIPVLPISYGDALPLLRELGGPVAPASWRGALPLTYHLGPGPAKVRIKLEFDWTLQPARNVIASIPGN